MKSELSILIPTYNDPCVTLVRQICQQAEALAANGLVYEVIVADDGSTHPAVVQENSTISQIPHCRFIRQPQNMGRAAIRNFLALEASYKWLLFIDSDMRICRNDYLEQYLSTTCKTVVYGGYQVANGDKDNLRFLYEKSCERKHTVEERKKKPNRDFHTSNFMVNRETFLSYPLDEHFRHYGYEDVFWGKMLGVEGIAICHIDNPVSFENFESNSSFLDKTEEALRTLHQFSHLLKDDSRLIRLAQQTKLLHRPARWLFNLCAPQLRRLLCGQRPTLSIFNLYRLGYYISLSQSSHKSIPST